MKAKRDDLVMAFYPNARGFAYVIFEGPFYPVDWGISDVLHKEVRVTACVRRLSALIDRYRPDCLVLRDGHGATSSAATAVKVAEKLAGRKDVLTHRVSRQDIQRAFAHLGSPTRYAIAESIAKQIPMFAPFMPPPRKIWNGEDRRMALFDAVALAVTFLQHKVSQER
jgi:hypothetical protein